MAVPGKETEIRTGEGMGCFIKMTMAMWLQSLRIIFWVATETTPYENPSRKEKGQIFIYCLPFLRVKTVYEGLLNPSHFWVLCACVLSTPGFEVNKAALGQGKELGQKVRGGHGAPEWVYRSLWGPGWLSTSWNKRDWEHLQWRASEVWSSVEHTWLLGDQVSNNTDLGNPRWDLQCHDLVLPYQVQEGESGEGGRRDTEFYPSFPSLLSHLFWLSPER